MKMKDRSVTKKRAAHDFFTWGGAAVRNTLANVVAVPMTKEVPYFGDPRLP